jgi:lysophospholipase L1-like esterase
MVQERVAPFVETLRRAHPDTPIVLVENIEYQNAAVVPGSREGYVARNAALREVYDRLVAAGTPNLTLVPAEGLLGDDGEATVDGTHATDLGFFRMADALEPVLSRILGR